MGGYPLLARLGAGGMGRVYLTRTPGGRALALKTILAEHTRDPGFRRRFEREIRNADRVRSPWTVPVVDWSRGADGDQWLATEYVPAPSLQEWVDRAGPLPPPLLRELTTELLRALAAVHGEGLVHRDLKPSNVLLGPHRPLLIDFGIARAVDDSRLTGTGNVVGSPGYLAPEQISGRAEIGPATDLFALGALLVFAATGRGPFTAPDETPGTPVLLYRAVHDAPRLDGVPEDLRPFLTALLSKDPAGRPTAARPAAERKSAPGGWAAALPASLSEELRQRAARADGLSAPTAAPPPLPAGPPTVTAPGTPPPPGHSPSPGPRAAAPPAPAHPGPPAAPPGRTRLASPVAAAVLTVVALLAGGFLLLDRDGRTGEGGGGAGTAPSSPSPGEADRTDSAGDGDGDGDGDGEEGDGRSLAGYWVGKWEGVGPGQQGYTSQYRVNLELSPGEVGDVVGHQVSSVTDNMTGLELGCTETLKLIAVRSGELVLQASSGKSTAGAAWIDSSCDKNPVYTLTPDTEDVMHVEHPLDPEVGAPDSLRRVAR
ncbi:hypothetical protein GCM10009716_32420 [Streptomyces sodiiphilus]|uniref:Protein kinase domain-containing protein n=2 Tax=Streptomyces sodiiphilus TaxID=226217 RepID=A0ABP5ASH0_9ACTN